jgi:transcriptional regulator GlxA family with amidase domain
VKDVCFVVLPGTLLLDMAGLAEAFRLANQRLVARGSPAAYRLRYLGPRPQVESSVGALMAGLEPLPATLPHGAMVVLMGQPSGLEAVLQRPLSRDWTETRRWLANVLAPRLASGSAELVTICAGTLLAADAGLLAGRRCTTHHESLDDLQRMAPQAAVVANRVFVRDGPLSSSAGITAGIDLALHLVARDCGDVVAATVAQVMVVYARRGPDDPELSPLRQGRDHLHPAVHRVQDAVSEQPAEDWPMERLAAVAHVTPRHLSRLFRQHAGQSPREFVEGVRLALAERAVSAGQAPKQAIAAAGIGGDRQWRRMRARQRRSALVSAR